MPSENTHSAHVGTDIAAEGAAAASSDGRSEPTLVAYELPTSSIYIPSQDKTITWDNENNDGFELVRARPGRDWMNTTDERFANRCLPMLIANQAGWLIINNCRLTIRWNGGRREDAVKFVYRDEKASRWVHSNFGHGIITWNFPFLFRTSPGYNLLVRGPANHFKDGIVPLEGMVETDWAASTFTMNWKITRPGFWITFQPGEPVCMLVPQRRGELEAFRPQISPLEADPELRDSHDTWRDSRAQFLKDHYGSSTPAATEGWQKHYFQGSSPDGSKAPVHQTRLRLRSFKRSKGD